MPSTLKKKDTDGQSSEKLGGQNRGLELYNMYCPACLLSNYCMYTLSKVVPFIKIFCIESLVATEEETVLVSNYIVIKSVYSKMSLQLKCFNIACHNNVH